MARSSINFGTPWVLRLSWAEAATFAKVLAIQSFFSSSMGGRSRVTQNLTGTTTTNPSAETTKRTCRARELRFTV
jgi:hypothetical protein